MHAPSSCFAQNVRRQDWTHKVVLIKGGRLMTDVISRLGGKLQACLRYTVSQNDQEVSTRCAICSLRSITKIRKDSCFRPDLIQRNYHVAAYPCFRIRSLPVGHYPAFQLWDLFHLVSYVTRWHRRCCVEPFQVCI